jgi:hypothetical protein
MFNTSKVSLNHYQIPLQQLREDRLPQSIERRSLESNHSLGTEAADDQLASDVSPLMNNYEVLL